MKKLLVLFFVAIQPSFMLAPEKLGSVASSNGHSISNNNGINRVTLPTNIITIAGVKKNVLTNAMFGWRVDKNDNIVKDERPNKGYENTIFVVENDYDLNNAGSNNKTVIHLPQGSLLVFQGGSFKNGTVDCHGASFEISGKYNVFHDTKLIDPSLNTVFPEWFYEDCKNHLEIALQRINDNFRNYVRMVNGSFSSDTELIVSLEGNYKIGKTVTLDKPFKLIGNASNRLSIDSQISSILIPDDLTPVFKINGKRSFECEGVQFCSVKSFNHYSSDGVTDVLFSISSTGNCTVRIENCSFRGIHQVINAAPVDKSQKEVWLGGGWNVTNNTFLLCHDGIVVNNVNKGLRYSVGNMNITHNTFDCSNYAIRVYGAFGIFDINHNTFESNSGVCKTYIEGAAVPCSVLYNSNYIEPHGSSKDKILEVKNVQFVEAKTNLVMSSKQNLDVELYNVNQSKIEDNGNLLRVIKK